MTTKPLTGSILASLMGKISRGESLGFLTHVSTGKVAMEKAPLPQGPGLDRLREILGLLPPLSLKFGPWVAGGAVRRLMEEQDIMQGDLDLFFTSSAEWLKFTKVLNDYELLHASSSASTYLVKGVKVQLIKRRFYEDLDGLFEDFDFTACQLATDGREVRWTNDAVKDIKDRRLRMAPNGRVSNITLVGRLGKYVAHGFIPEPGLYGKIIEAGLSVSSLEKIFRVGDRPASNYEHDIKVDEVMDAKLLSSEALRQAAFELDLEIIP